MRKHINRIYGNAKKPFAAVWKWATRPEEWKKRLRRWKALISWTKARQQEEGDKFEKARAVYRDKVHFLENHHDPKPPPNGLVEFDGLQVPGWIVEIAKKVRAAGKWQGTVISGYRSPEFSRQLCQNMCGADSCPGRCAGVSSNHTCPPTFKGVEPEGAIDVSDFFTFATELQRLGFWDKLKNDLPADRVHFSRSGH